MTEKCDIHVVSPRWHPAIRVRSVQGEWLDAKAGVRHSWIVTNPSVAISADGSLALVGAAGDDSDGVDVGRAYLFDLSALPSP